MQTFKVGEVKHWLCHIMPTQVFLVWFLATSSTVSLFSFLLSHNDRFFGPFQPQLRGTDDILNVFTTPQRAFSRRPTDSSRRFPNVLVAVVPPSTRHSSHQDSCKILQTKATVRRASASTIIDTIWYNHQHIGHTIPSSLQQGSAAGTFSQRNQGAAAQRLKKLNVPYKNIEIAEPKNQGDDGDDQMFHYNSL